MNTNFIKQLTFLFFIFYTFSKIYSTEIIKFIDNNYQKYFEDKEFFNNINYINSNVLILKMDKKENLTSPTKTEYFQNNNNFNNKFTNKYQFEIIIKPDDSEPIYKFKKYDLKTKMFIEDKTFKIDKKWILVELIDNNNNSEYYFINDIETKQIKTPEKTIYLTPLKYLKLNIKKLKIINSNLEDVNRIDFLFNNFLEEIDITNLRNTNKIKQMQNLFKNINLKRIIGLENLKTDNCENMSFMFCLCKNLKDINVSNFNTENVKEMRSMFYFTGIEEIDISNFNTKNCEYFEFFLAFCENLKKIIGLENLDFTNTKSYTGMFKSLMTNNLKELNLSNIKFNKYDKYNYFTNLLPENIKKIILPKHCFPDDFNINKDFTINSKIEEVECDGEKIKLEEYDDLRKFVNDPKTYINKTRNELKTNYENLKNQQNQKNIQIDNIKENTCCTIFAKCCCCKN